MGELINVNIIPENGVMTTSSKDVSLHFGKQHSHVLRDIDLLKKDISNFGEMFFDISIDDSYGRKQRAYAMTRDGFSLLAMGFTGSSALRWKLKYIDAFNKMEQAWNSPEAIMARALQFANRQLDNLKTQVAVKDQVIQELQPKATYYDLILNCKDLLSTTKIAKDYGKSAVWLNTLLHELGVQFKQSDIWLLYQKYADKGYTSTKTHTYNKDDGTYGAKVHTYWTQKGRLFIYSLLKSNGYLPLIELDDLSA
ncbi:MAG TPA: phage regulatory protein/antirepressor Ant [Thermoclostridium sp.]|nr:phage regulatory protein/antirepressor Ant [Thermoclostridium sp.]